jgi:hypothetical protein
MLKSTTFFVVLTIILGVFACTYEKFDPGTEPEPEKCPTTTPTYEANVKAILSSTCTYADQCHKGAFDSYRGLKFVLDDGQFKSRVITRTGNPLNFMPPSSVPAGRPTSLTAEQLLILKCWSEAGYPEK